MKKRPSKTFIFLCLSVLFLSLPVQKGKPENDVLYLFNQALEKETEEDYISAIFIYQDVLKLNPYFIDAKIGLSRSYLKTGNLTQSETLLKEALKQDRKNVSALNLLGRVYISLKKFEDALKTFNQALEIEPINVEAKFGLADLFRTQGEYLKAINLYNEVLKIYPQEVWTYIHLGNSYSEIGELEKAGGFYRKAVSLDYRSTWTHLNLARYYYKMGVKYSQINRESAREYFEAAIFEADTAISLDESSKEAYRILSMVYFYGKDYEKALDSLLKLVKLGEQSSIIYYEVGYCYEMLKDLERAQESYAKSLAKRIDDEIVRYRLENIVLSLKRETLSDPKRIELAKYRQSKARYLLEKNIMDKAFLLYKRAIQLDPLDPKKRLELADFYKARSLYELYLYELKDIIKNTLNVDTTDINDRIEIIESRVSKNLSIRWGVSQYLEDEDSPSFIPKTRFRVAVFDAFQSDYITEDFIHKGISKTLKEMLSLALYYYPKIEVVNVEDEIFTPQDALKKAKMLDLDYYIIGIVEEREDSLKVRARIISGYNGKVKEEFLVFFTGNDRVFNTIFSIAQDINRNIPLKGQIVRLEGNRALINLGNAHGVKKDMVFQITRAGELKRNPETGEFILDPEVSLGEFKVTEVDERVAEGDYTYTGLRNRVNVYDTVILKEGVEEKPGQ